MDLRHVDEDSVEREGWRGLAWLELQLYVTALDFARKTAAASDAPMARGTPRTLNQTVFFIACQNSGLVSSRS